MVDGGRPVFSAASEMVYDIMYNSFVQI
jgi:hypothetical protein